jgi:hypothetical protein
MMLGLTEMINNKGGKPSRCSIRMLARKNGYEIRMYDDFVDDDTVLVPYC